jgi:hypothetical protein
VLQQNGGISTLQIMSNNNYVDLCTKFLSATTFQKYVHGTVIRRFRDLQGLEKKVSS